MKVKEVSFLKVMGEVGENTGEGSRGNRYSGSGWKGLREVDMSTGRESGREYMEGRLGG